MAGRKKKTIPVPQSESEGDSDYSIGFYEPPEQPGDKSYRASGTRKPRARAPRAPSSTPAYGLRDHSQVQRPERYRATPVDPTRPLWVHPQPVFNHELAKLIPWKTLSPDHKGPIPSEMAYAEYLAEREQAQENNRNNEPANQGNNVIANNRDNAPANQGTEVVFRPFQKDGESSSGPTVAHLSRKSPTKDPLGYLYTADPSVVDNTKFHPPSDQYSYRNEYNPEFSLDALDEDTAEGQDELERRKAAYVDWASLSNGVKFAVVYDLVQDYGFTGTTQLLSLSVDEIIGFKKLYRSEKARWDAFMARIGNDVQDATERAPSQSARPFPTTDSNTPPAPALHLVTDSISKEDVAKGRRFLKFMGMNKYAGAFNKWHGCRDKFYEMPEVLNLDLDFLEETSHRYPGFDLNFPQTEDELEPHNEENARASNSPLRCPPSPGMPNPMAGVHWPPIIDENYNPNAIELANRAFRGIRNPLDPSEGPENRHGPKRDWNAPGLGLGLVIFDPQEKIRLEAAERLRREMNPGGVVINGNADERGRNLAMAGYRLATVEDLAPPVVGNSTGFQFAQDPDDFVPYVNDPAVLYNAKDFPDELLEEVNESDFLHGFDSDPSTPNNGSGKAHEQQAGPEQTDQSAPVASASGSSHDVDYDI